MSHGRSVPSQLLAAMPHVLVEYTADESILRGRDARWYPDVATIVVRDGVRGTRWHDAMLHELGHVMLGHPGCCGTDFYDQRREAEADAFAAVHAIPDLREMARQLGAASSYAHAARNLGTCYDLLEVRLANLTTAERDLVDEVVWNIHESIGA
jgi:hypothetical protein